MAQLFLTQTSLRNRINLRPGIPLSLRVGKFFLFFSMTFMIGLISFFYLVKFTEIHTKGYQLRRLEIERNHLMNERETQTTEIAKVKSLASIREGAIALDMRAGPEPIFLSADSEVALAGGADRN